MSKQKKQELSGPNQLYALREPLYLGLVFGKVLQSVNRQVIGNLRWEHLKGGYNSTLLLGTRSNPNLIQVQLTKQPHNSKFMWLSVSLEYKVGERGRRVLERWVFDERR